MFCTQCGKRVDDKNSFCPYCGAKLRTRQSFEVREPSTELPPPPPPIQPPVHPQMQLQMQPVEQKKKFPLAAVIIAVLAVAVIAAGTVFLINHLKEKPSAVNDPDTETADTGDTGGDDDQAAEEVLPYPDDAVEFEGHHYLIVNEAGYWSNARTLCENSGGHLVTITGQAEQDFIEQYIESDGTMKHYWLGGTDEKEEGEWEWITGEAWGYANWCTGQPNNTFYVDTEHGQDYLELQVTRGDQGEGEYMTWTDICDSGVAFNTVTGENFEEAPDYNSTKYYGYICEWDE